MINLQHAIHYLILDREAKGSSPESILAEIKLMVDPDEIRSYRRGGVVEHHYTIPGPPDENGKFTIPDIPGIPRESVGLKVPRREIQWLTVEKKLSELFE